MQARTKPALMPSSTVEENRPLKRCDQPTPFGGTCPGVRQYDDSGLDRAKSKRRTFYQAASSTYRASHLRSSTSSKGTDLNLRMDEPGGRHYQNHILAEAKQSIALKTVRKCRRPQHSLQRHEPETPNKICNLYPTTQYQRSPALLSLQTSLFVVVLT